MVENQLPNKTCRYKTQHILELILNSLSTEMKMTSKMKETLRNLIKKCVDSATNQERLLVASLLYFVQNYQNVILELSTFLIFLHLKLFFREDLPKKIKEIEETKSKSCSKMKFCKNLKIRNLAIQLLSFCVKRKIVGSEFF